MFWIGQIRVAELKFVRDGSKRVFLRTFDGPVLGPYENMSEAMKEMHRRLSSPPVE